MDMNQLAVNAIRVLSIDAIQKAKSGHPGTPLGAAPLAYELWAHHMSHNPANPKWINRDRFVLSAGHASMLEYALLYLFGYGLTMDDLQNFRQWESLTPGHPEFGHTKGVEATSGPLGQGIATAVGMALAEAHLAERFNREGFPIIDHYTYALAGDGCMMEGVSGEASSLAGALKLGKLIVFYDDNGISIEGDTSVAFTEDVSMRYRAYGWQVIEVNDGNDIRALSTAIKAAKREQSKPSLIHVRSKIGYGTPLAGLAKTHGEPLGAENITRTKETLEWPCEKDFEVPAELTAHMESLVKALGAVETHWNGMLTSYEKVHPDLYKLFMACHEEEAPDLSGDPAFWAFEGKAATRSTSGKVLNLLADRLPNLVGGSADLAPSNKSEMTSKTWLSPDDYSGSNIHFGVREFAMAAVCNGLAVHGGLRSYCATFFVFSDYLKPALRLSALMGLPVTYVLTHDSIGVGEDGPTHQPIEQLAALRATPNVAVFRPADGRETSASYLAALHRKGPSCIVATRQDLPSYENSGPVAMRGGYVLSDCEGDPALLLIASGSEVELIVEAQKRLAAEGIAARVVSMPCMELFEEQDDDYRASVLPRHVRARLAVEAGASQPWYRYVGLDGDTICLDHFGASAPAHLLFEAYGFTVDNVVARAKALVEAIQK